MSAVSKKAKLREVSTEGDHHAAEKESAGCPRVDETNTAAVAEAADEAKNAAAGEEKNDMIEKLEMDVEALKKETEELCKKAAQFEDEAKRARADFYNYRARVEKAREIDRVLAAERAVDSLLPVLDNLDRTLAAVTDPESPLYKGVAMVQRQFFGVMQTLGLRVINTDGLFDPKVHEAIMEESVDDEKDDNMVLAELLRGYTLGDKVLRAAQVKVGKKNQ